MKEWVAVWQCGGGNERDESLCRLVNRLRDLGVQIEREDCLIKNSATTFGSTLFIVAARCAERLRVNSPFFLG